MTIRPPQQTLDPSSQKWARWHDDQILSIVRERERDKRDSLARDKALAATLKAIQSQQATLVEQQQTLQDQQDVMLAQQSALQAQQVNIAGRNVMSAESLTYSQSWTTTQHLTNFLFPPVATFSLTESRVVSIEFAFQASLFAQSRSLSSAASAKIDIAPGIGIDSTTLSVAGSEQLKVEVVSGAGLPIGVERHVAPVTTRRVVTLPAGVHTVRAGLASVTIERVNTAYDTVEAIMSTPRIFIDIVQPA